MSRPKAKRTVLGSAFDDTIPTWDDIRHDLRSIAAHGGVFVGVELRYDASGLSAPDTALASRYAPAEIGPYLGFGVRDVDMGPKHINYVLPLREADGGMGVHGQTLFLVLSKAGRRLSHAAQVNHDRDAETWFRRLLDSLKAKSFTVTGSTNAGTPTRLTVREVPDLVRSSLALIDRLAPVATPGAKFVPHLTDKARELWQYYARESGKRTYDDAEGALGMARKTIAKCREELKTAKILRTRGGRIDWVRPFE